MLACVCGVGMCPKKNKKEIVPSIETGIATEGIKVILKLPKNRKTTKEVKIEPSNIS